MKRLRRTLGVGGNAKGSLPLNRMPPSHTRSSSQVSSSHSSELQDRRRVLGNGLESSKRTLDFRAATKYHARIITCGHWTYPSPVASLVSAYVRCNHTKVAERVLNHITSSCYNVAMVNIVLRNLMSFGDHTIAGKLFNRMSERDVVTWNSMVGGLVKNGRYMEALDYFRDMLGSDVKPDGFTFTSVLTGCARLGVLSHASSAHQLMVEKKIEANFILNAALVDMYSKCGKIEMAREIFDSVPRDDVSVWNAMINGLAIHGRAEDAIAVFRNMKEQNVLPDCITFLAILTAFSRCGLVEEGREHFNLMKNHYSIQPELEHYGAMVDLLSRAGLLDEAYATIKEMPMKPDAVIWRALLSSCRIFKRPDLGELVMSNILHCRSGDYVLLSNTYCSLTRWNTAESLRNHMKRKGIRKNCGKSWIDFAGKTCQFISGDRSHPETEAIYKVLNGLTTRAKTAGFVPAMDLVMMDVSGEEKEENLNFHSEKLAVAYGVLKSSPGSEIVVLKNLRICCDCHCWIELVSKILLRVIVVRDRLRFHRFEGGSCSCGNYW